MTTSTTKPRRAKRRKPKPMTETSYQVTKENEVEIPKVTLPKPTDNIIPLSSYVEDIKNRWKIHEYEINELSKDITWTYDKLKPYLNKVRERLSPKSS